MQAWNRHDFAALDTLLASDAVHEDLALNFQGQGAEQIKDFMRSLISQEPDFDWRLTTVFTAGPLAGAEWTWTATYTGDSPNGKVVGRRIAGRGASVARIENGRIQRFTDYYDAASFFGPPATGSAGQ